MESTYVIYCDFEYLYVPDLIESLPISEAVLKQELNRADMLTFKIYPSHPLYDKINLMKSTITVFDGDEPISILRPIVQERSFDNVKKFTCEGCLAFFNDSIQPEYSYSGSVEGFFKKLVNEHCNQVKRNRQPTGTNELPVAIYEDGTEDGTGFDKNNYIVRANSAYPNTWDEMCDKLLDPLGGYLMPVYRKAVGNGAADWQIRYSIESGEHGQQVVQFGQNLLDFSESIDRTDRFTEIVPLGAKPDGSESFLTVADAIVDGERYGKTYIRASEADVAKYGIIRKTNTWDDVTIANNLYAKGKDYLEKHLSLFPISMTVSAADLSYLSGATERFRIGQINDVYSIPHGIDLPFRCVALQIRFDNLAENVYTFGEAKGTLTRMI